MVSTVLSEYRKEQRIRGSIFISILWQFCWEIVKSVPNGALWRFSISELFFDSHLECRIASSEARPSSSCPLRVAAWASCRPRRKDCPERTPCGGCRAGWPPPSPFLCSSRRVCALSRKTAEDHREQRHADIHPAFLCPSHSVLRQYNSRGLLLLGR